MGIVTKGMILEEGFDIFSKSNLDIKVGAKNGSNFIFCGPAKELEGVIDTLEEKYLKQLDDYISSAKKNLNFNLNTFPTLESYSRSEFENSNGEDAGSFDGYIAAVNKHFEKINSCRKRLAMLNKRLEKRTNLRERKVLDVYNSIVDQSTQIIIIEGHERGYAWDAKEYREGVSKEDMEDEE